MSGEFEALADQVRTTATATGLTVAEVLSSLREALAADVERQEWRMCLACGGEGRILVRQRNVISHIHCADCRGRGSVPA